MFPWATGFAVRVGEHACCRYATAEDRDRIVAAFVGSGLRRGHKVVALCEPPAEAAIDRLAAAEADLQPALDSGRLEVRDAASSYQPSGGLDVEAMLAFVVDQRRRALAAGYPALSFSGEARWAGTLRDGDPLLAYEARLADVLDGRTAILCLYRDGDLAAATRAHLAALHPVDIPPELAALDRSGALAAAHVDGGALRLAGELDISNAEELAAVLHAHVAPPVRLDLADLRFIDVTGMRALRSRSGEPVDITAASPAVHRLVSLMAWDTDPDLRLPEAGPGEGATSAAT